MLTKIFVYYVSSQSLISLTAYSECVQILNIIATKSSEKKKLHRGMFTILTWI